ncbi:MAG: Crp/Fnr family transcriptional regulator [Pseudomonadota bacterium]|nr:Crp/Fnr family transcriptional regulator [Pseudomonadota bacterium]
MTVSTEFDRYPKTGRFLAGRLRSEMSEAEKTELEGLVVDTMTLRDGARAIARGDACNWSAILIDGFVLRTLENGGRRYAVSFHVPGDFVDLHCFALRRLDHNIDCVGEATFGRVPHDAIARVMEQRPHLARLFWFATLLDAAMHREWIMKLEQSTVPKRIAHVFAEIWRRLEMVGRAFPDGFETPLRQSEIAEMCGATAIHTNRALADLRRNDLADFRRGEVRIRDRARLEDYAGFRPDYLYGEGGLALRRAG